VGLNFPTSRLLHHPYLPQPQHQPQHSTTTTPTHPPTPNNLLNKKMFRLGLNLNRIPTLNKPSYYSTTTTTAATTTTKQTTSTKPAQQTPKFARFVHKPSPPRIPKPHRKTINRSELSNVKPTDPPSEIDGIETVEAFLESLRRPSLLSLTNKFTEWDQLFSLEPKTDLVKDGTLSVPRERRYLLRSMELFR
jgi:hypothetical protein